MFVMQTLATQTNEIETSKNNPGRQEMRMKEFLS